MQIQNTIGEPGMVVHTCNPSTLEADTGEYQVPGQRHSETLS
jgi:hypothetical protein